MRSPPTSRRGHPSHTPVHLRCIGAARSGRRRSPAAHSYRDDQRRLLRAIPGDSWAGTHDRLGRLKMPVLVIHGETDRLVPPENGRIIARAIPHAELVMLPNASHIFFTDQPGLSQTAILSFLAR